MQISQQRTYENLNVPIEEEPYYYGKFSRQDAEKLLEYDGDYLIRISPKSADNVDDTEKKKVVLTTRYNGKCLHFIIKEENGVGVLYTISFKSCVKVDYRYLYLIVNWYPKNMHVIFYIVF